MGKLKETWAEIMDNFDLKYFLAGICVSIAAIAFLMGLVLAIDTGNCLWFLLLIVSGVSFGFLLGVKE